jgi:transposase
MKREQYPTDVSDDEWAFVVPYLTLMREDAAQRDHEMREVFNGVRWMVRGGASWRMMPHDLPPWAAVAVGSGVSTNAALAQGRRV